MKKVTKNPIVLLPGWGFKASIWNSIVDSLPQAEVHCIDLPKPQLNSDITALTHQLNQTLPDQSIIVAWSLSGLLAIALCQYFPKKCIKLILVNSLPQFFTTTDWLGIPTSYAERFKRKAKTDLNFLLQNFKKSIAFPNVEPEGSAFINLHVLHAQDDQHSLVFYLSLLFTANYRESFSQLTIPIEAIFSEKDAIIPVAAAQQLMTLNSQVNISILKNASHIPFITHPKIFKTLLNGIINEST